jgi:hypothetical protein
MARRDGIGGIDRAEIERRRERVRRTWSSRPVDHLPLGFVLEDSRRCTLGEPCGSGHAPAGRRQTGC